MNVSMKFHEHMDYIHNIPIQWRHIPFISPNLWTQPLFFSRSQICRKSSMKLDDALLKKNSPINSQLNHSPSPLKFLSFIIQQLSVPMIYKNEIKIISTNSLLRSNFPPIFPAFWPQLPSRQLRFMELLRAEELSNFLNRADNSSISREEISKLRGWADRRRWQERTFSHGMLEETVMESCLCLHYIIYIILLVYMKWNALQKPGNSKKMPKKLNRPVF